LTGIPEGCQKCAPSYPISFRPITDEDLEFLYRLYASTRLAEVAPWGWDDRQVETFLRMQFKLQHTQYMQNYASPSFSIILAGNIAAGRLYLDRKEDSIRVVDISLLPEFRGKGIGGRIMRALAAEADAKGQIISLHVEMNNPVLGFYKTLGFKEKELRGIYCYMEREVNRFLTEVV
jgi:ribosomal protein S18 acetylase RimI-like enzyme